MSKTALARQSTKTPAMTPAKAYRIREAIYAIDDNAEAHLSDLIVTLESQHNLRNPKPGVGVKLYGIKGSKARDLRTALVNWANAARRALLRAGV